MGSVEHQALVSAAVADAVESFCAARRPRTPTNTASQAGEVSRQATAPAAGPYGQSSSADPCLLREPQHCMHQHRGAGFDVLGSSVEGSCPSSPSTTASPSTISIETSQRASGAPSRIHL